jgi:hypothetical protein
MRHFRVMMSGRDVYGDRRYDLGPETGYVPEGPIPMFGLGGNYMNLSVHGSDWAVRSGRPAGRKNLHL